VINLLRIQHERQRKEAMFPSIGEYTKLFGLNNERFARTKPDRAHHAPPARSIVAWRSTARSPTARVR